MEFKIKNVNIIDVFGSGDMVEFDLVTEKGSVTLQEHVNYDEDGDFKSVEMTDSNIKFHLEDEICSVFDMSDKPSLMPPIDLVPFREIIEQVESALE